LKVQSVAELTRLTQEAGIFPQRAKRTRVAMKVTTGGLEMPTRFLLMLSFAAAFLLPAPAFPQDDPCSSKESNPELRACYDKANVELNVRLDSTVKQIVVELDKDAEDGRRTNSIGADSLRKAGPTLTESQMAWETYRSHYCDALKASFAGARGGAIAYERCEFTLGSERLKELRKDLAPWLLK